MKLCSRYITRLGAQMRNATRAMSPTATGDIFNDDAAFSVDHDPPELYPFDDCDGAFDSLMAPGYDPDDDDGDGAGAGAGARRVGAGAVYVAGAGAGAGGRCCVVVGHSLVGIGGGGTGAGGFVVGGGAVVWGGVIGQSGLGAGPGGAGALYPTASDEVAWTTPAATAATMSRMALNEFMVRLVPVGIPQDFREWLPPAAHPPPAAGGEPPRVTHAGGPLVHQKRDAPMQTSRSRFRGTHDVTGAWAKPPVIASCHRMDGGGLVLVLDRTIDEGAEPVLIACPAPDEGTVAAKLYAMRTTIAAVDDVARGVAGSTTAAVHLRLDGLLLTAATVTPSQRAGFSICVIREGDPTALAQSIAQAVRFRFGELDVQGVQRRTGDVKAFLGAYMAKVMHPCRSGCVLVADHVATFKPGLSASVQISELLTAVETSPRAMVDTAITGRPRYCTPLGACLFRRGLCIGSHLPLPDVVDTARFCAIQGIVDRSEHDGLVVSWHRVHPSGERSRILCMVASADIVACMQFVCHSEGTPDGHIDPFYTSELQNLAIGFARGDHRDLLVQVDRDLQRYAGLVVSLDDLPAELHSRADQGRVVVVAPPSPQSRSAPSSPRIRRRARASSLSPRRLPSAVPDAGPQVDGPPRRITIGDPNVLLHYVIIDRASSTRFDSDPPRDGASDLDRQVVACFHRAVARMERQLDRSVRDKRRQDVDRTAFPGLPAPVLVAKAKCELNGDENRKRFGSRRVPCPGTVEQRLKFDLTAGSPSVAFADRRVQFWVIGRLVPPATECYVCVEGSVPQNTVDLAFQLVAAWS